MTTFRYLIAGSIICKLPGSFLDSTHLRFVKEKFGPCNGSLNERQADGFLDQPSKIMKNPVGAEISA